MPPVWRRRIEPMRERVRARVEVVIVLDSLMRTPHRMMRGMIPVAADHAADVIDRNILPGFVADVLPARNLFQHEQPISSQASRKCRDCG